MADSRGPRIAAFGGMAILSTVQEVLRATVQTLGEHADRSLVAEETLSLVATVSARAAEFGLREEPMLAQSVSAALVETPFLYHDLLLGAELVEQGAQGDVDVDQSVYERLARKMDFYVAHFPAGQLPGSAALRQKLPLWMGRISPTNLPSSPDERVEGSGASELLVVHLRLITAFAQKARDPGTA